MQRHELVVLGIMLALGATAPLYISQTWMTVVTIYYFYALLAMSWNMVFGYAGLFSFGHVAFSALGGYTSALLAENLGIHPFLGLACGGLGAALFGVLLGLVILRVQGFYLCLVTWAFAEVVVIVIRTEHEITGGTGGFITRSFVEGAHGELYAYFIGLSLVVILFVVSALLAHSRWGLYLNAIRDDIDAAETMGVNTRFWKVFGFAFGSAWAGVAGAFYAHYFNLVDPTIGGLDEMGKICLMVIIGGVGTVLGPVLGSFFVVIMSEVIRGWMAEMSLLVFAVIMILTMRFARGGFMELLGLLGPRLRQSLAPSRAR